MSQSSTLRPASAPRQAARLSTGPSLLPAGAPVSRLGSPSDDRLVQLKPAPADSACTAWTGASPASSGASLPDDVRVAMERRFQVSFSDVRVHSGTQAMAQAEALGARAFTQGPDIHFAAGHYSPRSRAGLGLLAHELTHVVQQRHGRFRHATAAGRSAQSRHELEQEAERVERSVQFSSAELPVHGHATDRGVQASPGLVEELRARAFGNIETIANYVVTRAANPVIRRVQALRTQLRGLRELPLAADVAARFEAIYNDFRSAAPGWLPVPAISFAGPPAQFAAVVIAIPLSVISLFLAFLLVMLWLLGNLDPATRRARERAVEEVVERIREATRPRPRPAPETEPRPEPEPRTRPQPEIRPRPEARPRPETAESEPRTETRPTERVGPDVIAQPRTRRRPPGAYPLLWPRVFGPPMLFDTPITLFVKSPQQERDESYSLEVRRELWARHRHGDPDLLPPDFHAHHIVPLFLGGLEGARGNITFLPGHVHLRGHGQLASQPQMQTPPPPLAPLPRNLLRHPTGTRYFLAGFK